MKQSFMVWNFSFSVMLSHKKFQILVHFGFQILRIEMLNLYCNIIVKSSHSCSGSSYIRESGQKTKRQWKISLNSK